MSDGRPEGSASSVWTYGMRACVCMWDVWRTMFFIQGVPQNSDIQGWVLLIRGIVDPGGGRGLTTGGGRSVSRISGG